MEYLNYEGLKYYHQKVKTLVQEVADNIPEVDLTGYATESWVQSQNYLTEHQDISGKADSSRLDEVELVTSAAINKLNENIVNVERLVNQIEVPVNLSELDNDCGFITSSAIPTEYITAEEVQGVPDGEITLRAVTYIQDRTTSTDTSFTLAPNYKYLFGEKASLSITLGAITDPTIVNHYMFEFTSGSTATTLSLPASIKWTTEPSIKPNKIY